MITDVFIIGGGPAGLAAALAARGKGFSVTVADCAAPPIDKACGEAVMPDGLAALAALGVNLNPAEAFPIRGIRFVDYDLQAEASFPSGVASGIRRTALHGLLVEHAEAAGISMLWGARIDGVISDAVRVNGNMVPCRWIIGADGENSRVREWAGLNAHWRNRSRFGSGVHYRVEPWTDCMELYWGQTCQINVTPVASDSVCVAVLSDDGRLIVEDALVEFPELAGRLQGREVIGAELEAVSASRKLVDVYRGSVGLIGDASGSVDALTGEGLGIAFRQAAVLADALELGDLSHYQEMHARIGARSRRMDRVLLALARHPRVREAAMRKLAANPNMFSTLLALSEIKLKWNGRELIS